jgi:leucyl aminopeptidase
MMKKTFTTIMFVCATLAGTLRAQTPSDIENLLSQINADSLLRTVMDLQNFGSRFALREGGNIEVAEYLVQRLNNYGITAEIDSFYKTGQNWIAGNYSQWFYNVKGILPASNPKDDSLVLIGAHLDAISYNQYYQLQAFAPGADDNASGVAVMIELARICHENNLQFRRDIHFMAYDGEELGLYGSYFDAQKRTQDGDKIAIMLNNDMVSYQPDDNWRVKLHWYDNALDIVSRAADLCAQYTDIDPVIPSASGNEDSQYSDSYAYYQFGFRAVFAIEYTFSTSYHSVHDVWDSNNYAYHADIARYNMAMLMDYAESTNIGIDEHPAVATTHVYPNPVTNTLNVQYRLDEDSPVSITVLDLTGRIVFCQPEALQSAGINHAALDFTPLPAGIYLCQIRTNNGVETVKVIRR